MHLLETALRLVLGAVRVTLFWLEGAPKQTTSRHVPDIVSQKNCMSLDRRRGINYRRWRLGTRLAKGWRFNKSSWNCVML